MKDCHPLCVYIYYINSEMCVTTGLGVKKNKFLEVDSRQKIVSLCVYVIQGAQATIYLF